MGLGAYLDGSADVFKRLAEHFFGVSVAVDSGCVNVMGCWSSCYESLDELGAEGRGDGRGGNCGPEGHRAKVEAWQNHAEK
jgi:hypothetical protein